MEIDMTYKLKVMQQNLEQEETEHKATKARLADKNKIYKSIEEAKSEAMKGGHYDFSYVFCLNPALKVTGIILAWPFFVGEAAGVGAGELIRASSHDRQLFVYHD